ncbi:alpha/beta hydrolase-fold protein [Pseudoteredinibacter isoporae]|uniref:alpha/beta hydrolase-fold protein n=1 Tax=Pseudoteredinibacter isoporae TaxID=570281 RepID=UPI003105CE4C
MAIPGIKDVILTLLFSVLVSSGLAGSVSAQSADQPPVEVAATDVGLDEATGGDSVSEADAQALTEPVPEAEEKQAYGFLQSHSVFSKVLDEERRYKVYLPASYYAKPDYNYPVLYLVDGDYNFLSIAAMVENLAKGNNPLIPEMIVVGISAKGIASYRNNMQPSLPLGKGGDADDFLSFIQDELKAEIRQHYRSSGFDILEGQSIGGLFVVNSLLTNSDSFSAYIAISPMMWWESYRMEGKVEDYLKKIKAPTKKLYLSLANEPRMGVYGLVEQLDRHRPPAVDWDFKHFSQENHDSVTLPALRHALKDLFAGWYISYKDLAAYENFDAVRNHYQGYLQRFNLQQAIPAYTYKALMHQYPKEEKAEKAASLYLQTTQHLPLSLIDLRNHLAALAIKEKEYDKAGELLQASFKENANDFSVQQAISKWHRAQRQWDEAEEAASNALALAKQQLQRDWMIAILEDELAEIRERK